MQSCFCLSKKSYSLSEILIGSHESTDFNTTEMQRIRNGWFFSLAYMVYMCNVDMCKVHICINCNTAFMTFHNLSNEGLLPRLSLLLGGGGPFELHSSRYGLGQGALQKTLQEGS